MGVDDASPVGPVTGPGTGPGTDGRRRLGPLADRPAGRRGGPACGRATRRGPASWWSRPGRREAAVDRATLLAALRTGISVADEPLLERALDDRSLKVRAAAVLLLDALPTSARADRMADRLRPLLRHRGLVRKQIEVDLPSEPDEAATRDGLTRPTSVGSVRGWWLQRIAAGAPLDVWTDVAGTDVRSTWRQVTDHDARAGIVEAVLARRDATWAAAVVPDVWSPDLLALLPPELVEQTATAQLAAATSPPGHPPSSQPSPHRGRQASATPCSSGWRPRRTPDRSCTSSPTCSPPTWTPAPARLSTAGQPPSTPTDDSASSSSASTSPLVTDIPEAFR